MRLIYTTSGREVTPGDPVLLHGKCYVIHAAPKPHKPASSGHVYLREFGTDHTTTVYVGVIDAEWIEREDRGEDAA
jgi:hypothetical protein